MTAAELIKYGISEEIAEILSDLIRLRIERARLEGERKGYEEGSREAQRIYDRSFGELMAGGTK